ncbi:YciI family protein [Thermoactinospora rubra]|uniref:YciI family protein n=1 Tax=Thermoactinospora rubra TaxID=1088767 RepID=UPI00146F9889|nr:YciI family protein [Thermoactinospora rubra]
MLHLLILRYRTDEAEAEPYMGDHVRFLERHHREGVFLVSGQTVPTSEGGAILAAGIDRPTAERIAAEDPFVKAGVAEYAITTITAGRVHPSLAVLLGVDESRIRGTA